MNDTPQITAAHYTTSDYTLGDMVPLGGVYGSITAPQRTWGQGPLNPFEQHAQRFTQHQPTTENPIMANSTRRIVKVFIADPNENVPLDKALIYTGPEKFTDATDTELYFEIPITDLLSKHNEQRVKWADKEASKKAGKDILLDAIRVRDLKMIVAVIAQF